MAEKCLIEQYKRTRVRGSGPRRNKLKVFHKIGDVTSNVIQELNYILDTNTQNDVGGDVYGMSQNCDYEKIFNFGQKYRQVLLQQNSSHEGPDVDEYAYTEWSRDYTLRYTRPFLDSMFSATHRFRLSEMRGDHELNWHIDADTSVGCRAQICLNHNDSVFEFKDREGVKSLQMKPGEVWFINTGWNHRVVSGDITRRSAIIGFNFYDFVDREKLLK